jgi:hypothetical protein
MHIIPVTSARKFTQIIHALKTEFQNVALEII